MDNSSRMSATSGRGFMVGVVMSGILSLFANLAIAAEPLSGTQPLTIEGDLSAYLLDGAHKFVDREIERSVERRERHWKRDFTSKEAYEKSVQPNRERLATYLGIVRPGEPGELVETSDPAGARRNGLGKFDDARLIRVSWPVVDGVVGHGVMAQCFETVKPRWHVILIPDANQSPEDIVGLTAEGSVENDLVMRLTQHGINVVIPAVTTRHEYDFEKTPGLRKRPFTNREFLYRQAFEGGRSVTGYDVQTILGLVNAIRNSSSIIAIHGHGQGAWTALAAGAIDQRIDLVSLGGNFRPREALWRQPIDCNTWGLFDEFGDAEMASLIVPRRLILCDQEGAATTNRPQMVGETPGEVRPVTEQEFKDETARLMKLVPPGSPIEVLPMRSIGVRECSAGWVGAVARLMDISLSSVWVEPKWNVKERYYGKGSEFESLRGIEEAITTRQKSIVMQWTNHTQALIRESEYVRKDFFKNADRKSRDPAKWQESVDWYRKCFYDEVIGRFEHDLKPFNPRTRQIYDTDKYRGYEVVLDVFDDVISYGILLVPKDLKPDERRPVVVCQHGLEGRPQDTIEKDLPGERYYHQFTAKLAERGFVTFAPQNLYIFKDRFRELQRKLNPLKKTLFSIIVPQHEQICRWLKTQPFVAGERIGFYGLSYGGKSAMRIPPLVDHYKAVICSGDFNEWIRKCTSVRDPFSYVGTGEYEIWEWNLANTFNYAEMAALICPRPFMVERGHRDGVGIDEWVDYEYAKVRLLYVDLKIPERTEIEHFDGPHEINGVGAYKFLHRHLNWPEPAGR